MCKGAAVVALRLRTAGYALVLFDLEVLPAPPVEVPAHGVHARVDHVAVTVNHPGRVAYVPVGMPLGVHLQPLVPEAASRVVGCKPCGGGSSPRWQRRTRSASPT